MRSLITSIEIEASEQAVWAALTDFASYSNWNPFVIAAKGELTVGSKLAVVLQMPGSKPMSIAPVVIECEAPKKFVWRGSMGLKGIFDGEHSFELVPTASGCLFKHSENFSGLLVPFLWNMLNTKTRSGFEAMNRALKERVESAKA